MGAAVRDPKKESEFEKVGVLAKNIDAADGR